MSALTTATDGARVRLLARALRLEYLTVGWNVIEGIVAIAAALAAGSVALLGFGADPPSRCATSWCARVVGPGRRGL